MCIIACCLLRSKLLTAVLSFEFASQTPVEIDVYTLVVLAVLTLIGRMLSYSRRILQGENSMRALEILVLGFNAITIHLPDKQKQE